MKPIQKYRLRKLHIAECHPLPPSISIKQRRLCVHRFTWLNISGGLNPALTLLCFSQGGEEERVWGSRGREREKNDAVEWGVLEHCPALAQISRLSSLMDLAKNKRKWRPMMGGWMNEWTLLQLYPLLHPKKQHSPITLDGNSETFLPHFRTKMFWCQAWLREVHSKNKRPPFSQSPDSEKSPGKERERETKGTQNTQELCFY